MASGSNYLTTYYAKRIIGDSAAANRISALLQTGENIEADTWILSRTNRITDYGIKYIVDTTQTIVPAEEEGGTPTQVANEHDKIQFIGKGNATAWVQLDTGDFYVAGKVGIGYNPTDSENDNKLYVNGTSYLNGNITVGGHIYADAARTYNIGTTDKEFQYIYARFFDLYANSQIYGYLAISTNGTAGDGTNKGTRGDIYLRLGNNIARTSADGEGTDNACGHIEMYGETAYRHNIYPGEPTANRNHWFPNATGWIVTGGNGTDTGAGDIDTPVYLKTDGTLAAITSYDGNAATVSRATFGDSGNGEHNANNIVSNGLYYYTSNGPSKDGANQFTTTDGAIYCQAYNTTWVGQIAQDYRNGALAVRGKNNGTWSTWYSIPKMIVENYPALLPPNNVNNWIKIGTANTSYGLLPSQSGGAGSGHNYLGTSSWYWKYAYIDQIYGYLNGNISGSSTSCTGNAATATKATQDGSGNVITSKYVTVDTAQTITGTKSWGTSGAGGQLNGAATNGGINSIRIGDDVWLGDCNASGIMGMKSTGTNCGFYFYNSSGTKTGDLYYNGTYLYTGNRLHINVDSDVSPTSSTGSIVIGATGGLSIGIDANEIMARSSNAVSTLYLNSEGGQVYIGGGGIYSGGDVALASGKRVHASGGNLYIGNASNAGWALTQDICSHSGAGDTYWSLRVAGTAHFKTAYGAVWNDYAEMRNVPEAQKDIISINDDKGEVERNYPLAGKCVFEIGNGEMKVTFQRLQKGCKIISDTFGFCIGETKECRTPIAVTGRVLAYPLEPLSEIQLHIGDFVCSGPNGTVSIMTREEIINYPESIVGTISELPTYDIWHCGNKDTKPIEVNGRIWIYVK